MNWLIRIERGIVLICCLFLVIVFCLVVLLRYGFESDLFAYEEWVLTVAFLLYFIGGALASHYDVHIKADILLEYIKGERTREIYQGVVLWIEAVVGAILSYFALLMVISEFERWPNIPATPVYHIPLAVPRFFILAGLVLMTLHAFHNGLRYIRSESNHTGMASKKGANQ